MFVGTKKKFHKKMIFLSFEDREKIEKEYENFFFSKIRIKISCYFYNKSRLRTEIKIFY